MKKLQPIADNIWLVDGSCVSFYGFAYSTRSVLVKLASGDLWFWSPIAFDPALKEEIDQLGNVRHLVSPNKIHHLFLSDWMEAYPTALVWGPKSTVKKRKDIKFEAPLTDAAPTCWAQEIEQIWVRGSFAMDEIVFFHKSSRTLIMADLSENFSDAFIKEHWTFWQRVLARAWGIVEGKGYAPLDWRLSFLSRRHLRCARQRFLALAPDNVVMAHGEWRQGDGVAFLQQALSWI